MTPTGCLITAKTTPCMGLGSVQNAGYLHTHTECGARAHIVWEFDAHHSIQHMRPAALCLAAWIAKRCRNLAAHSNAESTCERLLNSEHPTVSGIHSRRIVIEWRTKQFAATRHSFWRMRRAEAGCRAWRASCGYPRQAPLLSREAYAVCGNSVAAVCLAAFVQTNLQEEVSQCVSMYAAANDATLLA